MKWVVRSSSGSHEVEVERTAEGFEVSLDGRAQRVDLIRLDASLASLRFIEDDRSFEVACQMDGGRRWRMAVGEREFDLEVLSPVAAVEAAAAAEAEGPSRLTAPIPGKVVAVKVAEGDRVEAGQPLVVLEAMKMENELMAEQAGTVVRVPVESGMTVESGALLVELE